MTVLAQIPNPIDIITETVGTVSGWAFDKVADGISDWVLGAVEFFVGGAVDFLRSSSTPDVQAAWFSGADSPYAAVRSVAGVLLVGCALLGVIQGLVHGDPGAMVRRMAGGLPVAVAGMVVTTAVVAQLLQLTDVLSASVLGSSDDQALHFLSGFGAGATSATNGFAGVVLGLVAVVAGLFLWIELIVRSSLVYVLVALSPLAFAATVWPSARGVLRRTVELLLAIVLSKLVIAITLAVGVAALSGAGASGAQADGLAAGAGESVGTLLVGAVLLGLSAFAPFIVLKLIPIAEAAVVAAGVSRGPWRAAQAGMAAAYSVNTIQRLAGGGSSSGSGSAGGFVQPGPPGSPGTAGGSAIASGAAAGEGAGSGRAAAAGAAAGPAGVVAAVGVSAVSGAAKAGQRAADAGSQTSGRPTGSSADASSTNGRRGGDA